MPNNTYSIYVPQPLYDKVQAAVEAGEFKVKDVCVAALEQAVNPQHVLEMSADGSMRMDGPILSSDSDAQAFADDASQIEYSLQFKANLAAAQAMIDNVRDQGGWPISVAPSADGGFWILFAFPKALDEDNPPR